MYYSGIDPFTERSVFSAKNPHDKAMQSALMQYRNSKNKTLILEALKTAFKTDLIGDGPKCLVRPQKSSFKPNKFHNDFKSNR